MSAAEAMMVALGGVGNSVLIVGLAVIISGFGPRYQKSTFALAAFVNAIGIVYLLWVGSNLSTIASVVAHNSTTNPHHGGRGFWSTTVVLLILLAAYIWLFVLLIRQAQHHHNEYKTGSGGGGGSHHREKEERCDSSSEIVTAGGDIGNSIASRLRRVRHG
jgi:Na+/melibiose symporter-like transporter